MIKLPCPTIALLLCLQLSSTALAQLSVTTPAVQPAIVYVDAVNKTFEISNLNDENVRVELVPQPNVKAITASLSDVAFGDRHDQSLMPMFVVQLEQLPPEAKTFPALLIKVKSGALRSGTYKLRIDIRPAGAVNAGKTNTTPAPQFLVLEIKLPAAEIKALEKVVVPQTRFSPFPDDPVELSLTEVTGKVRLTDVKIDQTYPTGENVATSETVSFAPLAEIKPHTTGKAKISLNGEIPLGTSTIAAMISAPQLEKPVFLSIEVQSRRAKWIIVLVMILGLVLGFVARIWTKQRVELDEARLKAIDAADTVEQALKSHPDAVFQERVKLQLNALKALINNGTIDALNNQLTAVNQGLTDALKDLDVRRAGASTQLETLTRLAKNTATLPPGISDTSGINAADLQKARATFDLDNVAGAQEVLQPLVADLGDRLGKNVAEWRAQVKSLLDQVMQVSTFLEQPLSAGLEAEKTKISTDLDGLTPTTGDSSLEDITTLSNSVRRVGAAINVWLKNRVPVQLASQFNVIKPLFKSVQLNDPEAMNSFFKAAEELPGEFANWADNPGIGVKQSFTALANLQELWRKALLNQVDAGDAENREKLQALLDNKQYLEATQATISVLPAKDKALGSRGAVAAAAPEVSVIPFMGISEARATEAGVTIINTVSEQTLPPTLAALRASTLGALVRAKAVRFIIASSVILGIGYGLFANTFIGTWSELMTIFVWAFGLNISVDAVMDSISVKKIG